MNTNDAFTLRDRRQWKLLPWCIGDAEATTPDPDGDPEADLAINPAQARIFQLALRWRKGPRDTQTWVRWVNPGVRIHPKIIEVCKLTPEKLALITAAPPFEEIAQEARELLAAQGQVVVTYNGEEYDLDLVNAELQRAGQPPLSRNKPGADILHVDARVPIEVYFRGKALDAYAKAGRIGHRSLWGTLRRFDLREFKDLDAHDAGSDTIATQAVLEHMIEHEPFRFPTRQKVDTHLALADAVGEYLSWQGAHVRRIRNEYSEWGPWLYRQYDTLSIHIGAGSNIGRPLSSVDTEALHQLAYKYGERYGLTSKGKALIIAELQQRDERRRQGG